MLRELVDSLKEQGVSERTACKSVGQRAKRGALDVSVPESAERFRGRGAYSPGSGVVEEAQAVRVSADHGDAPKEW